MDTRPRILIVEDIDDMRETWVAVLERENYRADAAASVQAASAAIDSCSYHVALVDIMLAGKEDTSNRDGVKVLEHLRDLREGTQALVLSAQRSDIGLVRDVLREYDARDYVAKWDVHEKGNAFLLEKIKDALDASPLRRKLSWEKLTPVLAWGLSEQAFVSECLRLQFKGGFESLSRSLLTACEHLMPLLVEIDATHGIGSERSPDVLNGRYWSKGQGTAVELLIYGKNARSDDLEREWNLGARKPLYTHSKGQLSVLVLERPDLSRSQFSAPPQ